MPQTVGMASLCNQPVRRTKGEGEPPVAHRRSDAGGAGVDGLAGKEPHIGSDACGEGPRSIRTRLRSMAPMASPSTTANPVSVASMNKHRSPFTRALLRRVDPPEPPPIDEAWRVTKPSLRQRSRSEWEKNRRLHTLRSTFPWAN